MTHHKHTPVSLNDFEHQHDCPCCSKHHRRTFIKRAAIGTAGLLLPAQWATAAVSRERIIRMSNPHTGENIRTVFWTPDYGYIQPVMEQISWFFRDFRENETRTVDIDLLNILHYMQANVGQNRTINLHSGYRTPKTNAMLANHSNNVAKQSYHLKAKAADISISGFNARDLKAMALTLSGGGVGVYRGSNFIHVDSGPVRTWVYG